MISLLDNPLLVKHVRSRLRRRHVTPLAIGMVLTCSCILWLGGVTDRMNSGATFRLFVWIQGIVLLLMGTNQVASAVSRAQASGILDFHRASPLRPRDVAVGFLLGAPIREHAQALLVLPFALIAALQGGVGVAVVAMLTGLLWLSTLLFHSIAMVFGLWGSRTRSVTGLAVGSVVLAHVFAFLVGEGITMPGMLTARPAITELLDGGGASMPKFFGLALPAVVQSMLYQMPLLALVMLAVTRRMRSAEAHAFAKSQALVFLGVTATLILAGIVGNDRLNKATAVSVTVMSVGIVACLLIVEVTPDLGRYVAGVRRSMRAGESSQSLWADSAANLFMVLLLAVITSGAGVVAMMTVPGDAPDAALSIANGAAALVAFGAGAQAFALAFGSRAKPVFLLVLFVVWVLPLMISGGLSTSEGAEVARAVASISPVVGIPAPHFVGLGVQAALALTAVLYSLSKRAEIEGALRDAA